jgi:hypothetical protein
MTYFPTFSFYENIGGVYYRLDLMATFSVAVVSDGLEKCFILSTLWNVHSGAKTFTEEKFETEQLAWLAVDNRERRQTCMMGWNRPVPRFDFPAGQNTK